MANCFCTATPARVDSTTAADRTGSDSQMMVRSSASRARNDTTNTAMLSATMVQARVVVTEPRPSSLVARNSAGMVMTSPNVDTVGATRLSMSQPRRTAPSDSSTVAARTTRLASTPPATEMRARSSTPIALSTPKPTEITRATTARNSDSTNVSDREASTFWPSTDSRRNDTRNVPVWMEVEIRFPKAPKMLPRSPMAAGTITSRPGRSSNVPVRDPSTAPATRLVQELKNRATRLWRAASPVGPRRSTRRRPRSRGRGIQEGSRRAIVAECLCTGSGRPRAAGRTGSP